MIKEKTKKIRETFKSILEEKLEKIEIMKKKNVEIHKYAIPFLNIAYLVKNGKFLPKRTLNKYDKKYHEIMGY